MKIEKAINILENGIWWDYLEDCMPGCVSDELCDAVTVVTAAQKPLCIHGCSHCNNSTATDTLWEPGGAHDFRIQDGAIYYYDSASGWEGEAIRFCPWCGRMIDKEGRDENR